MKKRRPGFGAAFLAFFAVLPKTWSGWKILYRRFKLWRQMIGTFWRRGGKTPGATIVAVIAIGLYVVMPFDLIPDFFLFFGWLDDAFVVAKLFAMINIDLRRFLKQEHMDPKPFNLQDEPEPSTPSGEDA